ncbi:RHS repeat-associated core domain-containing protein [Pantoea sp. A4]|uniref:RHS repeat-associated core domain-containing protein n=1 Tax=Pantoea sp. A4 TaxID=1225184 RepID=UPI0003623106|nr:RHS repeat-associated core domain-containing protein [Pantoea sp. A4]
MSDNGQLAARSGDVLHHPSLLADAIGGIAEGALYAAVYVGGTALVASGIGVAIGVALVVGATVEGFPGRWGNAAGEAVDSLLNMLGWQGPPDGVITTGSPNVMIGGKPAARAAGKADPAYLSLPASEAQESGLQRALALAATLSAVVMHPQPLLEAMRNGLRSAADADIGNAFTRLFMDMVQPVEASAAPHTSPAPQDQIACSKWHLAPGPLFLAEGSTKVFINGQPAARHGDRSTCEAKISVTEDHRVRIGGGTVVVRDIRSGKNALAWFIGSLAGGKALQRASELAQKLYLRVRLGRMLKRIPCPLNTAAGSARAAAGMAQLPARAVQTAHPVNIATGAKLLAGTEECDFTLEDRVPLVWQRVYHSLNQAEGVLGRGWMLPWETRLLGAFDAQGKLVLTWRDPVGRECVLGAVQPGDVVQFPTDGVTLCCGLNGVLVLQFASGENQRYEPDPVRPGEWRMVDIHDRRGNVQYLDWGEDGRLSAICGDNEALNVRLYYHAQHGRLSRVCQVTVEDNTEHLLVAYDYTASGELVSVTDADGVVTRRFSWHANGLLATHRYAGGLRIGYDWTETADGTARVCGYQVFDDSQPEARLLEQWHIVVDEAGRSATVSQREGAVTRHDWDAQQRITRYVDPWQQEWHYRWAEHEEQLLATQLPDGGRWQYGYDARGRLEDVTSPEGRTRTTRWHDYWALPMQQVDEQGGVWRCERNGVGDITSMTEASGAVTRYQVNALGDVIRETDTAGNSRDYRYDSCGRLIRSTNCSGNSAWWRYDARGRLTDVSDFGDNLSRAEWSPAGRLNASFTPAHVETRYRYDRSGRYCGEETWLAVSALAYNARDQVVAHTSPSGRITRWQYDDRGNLTTVINPAGERWQLDYDPAGRLSGQQDYAGVRQQRVYDARGRVTEITDLPSADAAQAGMEASPAPWAWVDGVKSGKPVPPASPKWPQEPDMAPRTVRYGYDADDRLVTRDTAEHHTRYRWQQGDVCIQRCAQADLQADAEAVAWQETLWLRYDAAGQLIEESGPQGAWHMERDVLGNLTHLHHPDGGRENFMRYGRGALLHHHVQFGGRITELAAFQRDKLEREVERSMGPLTLRTGYDVEGHIIRRDSEIEERGCDWQPDDRLSGESVITFGQHHQRRYSYSADGDLLHHRSLTDDYFRYDVAGNRVDRADQRVWRNLLTRLGQTTQRFDGFGRVCERRLASGVTQRLFYNSEQQLSRVEFSGDARFSHVEYGYDALGRRSRKVLYRHRPVGKDPIAPEVVTFLWRGMRLAEERSSRHPGQALKYLYHEGSHEPLARVLCEGSGSKIEWYHCALNGQPEMLTDEQGKLIWRGIPLGWGSYGTQIGSYDRDDTLWSHQSLALQGQYVDQETGLHYNLYRYYCPLTARFTQPDPIGLAGGINPYQYAPNALSWIDPLGLNRDKCKPSSPGSMQKEVERGQAPREIERVDRGHIPGQEAHVHYSDGTSSNVSGGVHDAHRGVPNPTKKARKWLISHGWTPPE